MLKLQLMGKEQDRTRPAESLLLAVPSEIRGKIIRRGLENILKSTTIEYPEGFGDEVTRLATAGAAFEIVTNHTSHADAFPAAKIGLDFEKNLNPLLQEGQKINGFIMPFALSMKHGTQSRLLTTLFGDLQSVLEQTLHTTPVFTATNNDILQSRVDGTNAVSFTRLMIQGVKDGKAIIIFPEGRVEGGRRDGQGNLKGLQEFREDSMQQSLRISTSEKDRVAVIPAGISGGYNVYDPQRKALPLDSFLVGLGFSSKTLFKVKVGMPIVFEKHEIKQLDSKEIDRQIGSAIANLLPPQERGTTY